MTIPTQVKIAVTLRERWDDLRPSERATLIAELHKSIPSATKIAPAIGVDRQTVTRFLVLASCTREQQDMIDAGGSMNELLAQLRKKRPTRSLEERDERVKREAARNLAQAILQVLEGMLPTAANDLEGATVLCQLRNKGLLTTTGKAHRVMSVDGYVASFKRFEPQSRCGKELDYLHVYPAMRRWLSEIAEAPLAMAGVGLALQARFHKARLLSMAEKAVPKAS